MSLNGVTFATILEVRICALMWEEDGFEVHVMLKMECMHSRLLKLSLVTSVKLVEPTGKGTRSRTGSRGDIDPKIMCKPCRRGTVRAASEGDCDATP